jgi:hypothetical protein
MLFSNPIWLWALTGLSIPIGIHLLSRKEGKVIRIGSIRHLQETNTQQFKGIRLNEILLLILRCSLIILFVLLVSGLSFHTETTGEMKWVLIERGLENNPEIKRQLDNFTQQGYEARWLADGFPLIKDSSSVSPAVQYWKLINQLNSKDLGETIIISKNKIENFKGKRTSLPANIRWISVPSESMDYSLRAAEYNDSIAIRTCHASVEKTHFTTQVVPTSTWNEAIKPSPIDTIQINISADNAYKYDKKILVAALQAIDQSFPVEIKLTYLPMEKVNSINTENWCIWLSSKPYNNSVSSNIIYLNPDLNNNILIRKSVNRWVLTKRLNEEIALTQNLTLQLATIILPSEKLWDTSSQKDNRMLPDSVAWNKNITDEEKLATLPIQSASSYLIALLLLILLLERVIAYQRNQ